MKRDMCYCGKEKKVRSKTCVVCSGIMNRLRSRARYPETESGKEAKIELDKILKDIENFNNKK